MTIKLLHNSPLWLASHAIRMSHDNHDKSDTKFIKTQYGIVGDSVELGIIGEKDKELIARVGNKLKHKSVLEQLVYWFDIDGISRACLQELARHRTARMTVKSSRYTLKEIKDIYKEDGGFDEFFVHTNVDRIDEEIYNAIYTLAEQLSLGTLSNDTAKYMLPEAFKTRLQWQIDGRNLQNFLELRTSKDALWEIRLLARAVFDAIPDEHKYLYEEYMKDVER